jgi:hypothetical protein
MTELDFDEMYRLAAISLAMMNHPPVNPNTLIDVPGFSATSIRAILNWAATDKGRERLDQNVRLIILEFAARII